MPNTIQFAKLNDRIVGLADVERGQQGLTCFTCDDRLIVKDGRGNSTRADTRRRPPRAKHFSHTSHSQCHGEGPAHYRLKIGIAESIREALTMPADQRNSRGYMHYRCPDEQYGVDFLFKGAREPMTCPDTRYISREEITPLEMYTQPVHLANSHILEFSNRFNPNAKDPPPGWLTTVAA